MTFDQTAVDLDRLLDTFAAQWLRLGEPDLGQRLVADPVLVLGPAGTIPIPRTAFLAAVAGRTEAVSGTTGASTVLTGRVGQSLGDRMVLATLTWEFRLGDGTSTALVSDFLLQREGGAGLRCVAYLPRTNVVDHL